MARINFLRHIVLNLNTKNKKPADNIKNCNIKVFFFVIEVTRERRNRKTDKSSRGRHRARPSSWCFGFDAAGKTAPRGGALYPSSLAPRGRHGRIKGGGAASRRAL